MSRSFRLPINRAPDAAGRFSLTLSSKINRIVEDVVISIYLGAATTNVSATATGDRHPVTMGQPLGAGKKQDAQAEGFAGGGAWEFDPHAKVTPLDLRLACLSRSNLTCQVLRWTISSLAPNERPPTLVGSFTST